MSDSYETLKAQKDAIVARENRELDELRATFDLRYKADMRAIQRWQEATGKELEWPDHADLCVWLLDQLSACQREREEARKREKLGCLHPWKCTRELLLMQERAESAEQQLQQMREALRELYEANHGETYDAERIWNAKNAASALIGKSDIINS